MRILKATKVKSHTILTDDSEWPTYTRYGVDCWYQHIGESQEPVYNCTELERAYALYKLDASNHNM